MLMTWKVISDKKEELKMTPNISRPGMSLSDASIDTETKEIAVEESRVFKKSKFITQPDTEKFWDENFTEWQNKMEQA